MGDRPFASRYESPPAEVRGPSADFSPTNMRRSGFVGSTIALCYVTPAVAENPDPNHDRPPTTDDPVSGDGTSRGGLPQRAAWLTLPFRPFTESLRGYGPRKLGSDALAGLTVAVIAVPQAMAYAIIAGVPPQYGVYTVIFQNLVASLLTSQRFLSFGPTNTQALLVASTITAAANITGLDATARVELFVSLAFTLSLLKGLLQLGFAAMQIGAIVRYVSSSVIIGFTAGAGILIGAGQINNFLGVEVEREPGDWPGLIGIVQRLWPHLDEASGWAVGLGLASMAIVLVCRRLSRLIPGPLIAVAVGAAVVYSAQLTPEQVTQIGDLPQGLPGFEVPWQGLAHWQDLLPGAVALALLGVMEAYSIGRAIAIKSGERVSANQELFSQGTANLVTGFFNCFPGSGSFARSALNYYAGAVSPLSNIFNAVFVAVIFLTLTPAAEYIPKSALAAILFVVAFGLIDWRFFRRTLRSSRSDAIVCAATCVATLVLPLAYAVFVGILLNIALYLRRTSHLHLAEMVPTRGANQQTVFLEQPLRTRTGESPVIFVQIEGDLFFAVADELQDRLAQIGAGGARAMVFRLKRTHLVDATAMQVLETFCRQMADEGRHVIFCGLRNDLLEEFQRFGLTRIVGESNVFATSFGVFESAKHALRRARELVGSSVDLAGIDLGDTRSAREGAWYYQI